MDLGDHEIGPTQRDRAGANQFHEEGRVVAEDAQQLDRPPAETVDEPGGLAPGAHVPTPKSSASGRAG